MIRKKIEAKIIEISVANHSKIVMVVVWDGKENNQNASLRKVMDYREHSNVAQ